MSSWFFVIFGLQLLLISCNAEFKSPKTKHALVEGILQKLLNLTTASFTYAPTKVREKIINIIEQKLKRSAKSLGNRNSAKHIALIIDAIRSIKSDKDIIHDRSSEELISRNEAFLRTSEDYSATTVNKLAAEKSTNSPKNSKERGHKNVGKQDLQPKIIKTSREKKNVEESNEVVPNEVQFAYVNNINVVKGSDFLEPIRPRGNKDIKNTPSITNDDNKVGQNRIFDDQDYAQERKYVRTDDSIRSANDRKSALRYYFSHKIKPYTNVTFTSPCHQEHQNMCNKIFGLKVIYCNDNNKLPVEKLCDDFKDCNDYTDEVDCAKQGVNKVRDINRIMSSLLHAFSENCYTYEVEELFLEMQNKIWTDVVSNQFNFLEEQAQQYTQTDNRKFYVESKLLRKAVNKVAVAVSSMSTELQNIVCSRESLAKTRRFQSSNSINDIDFQEPTKLYIDRNTTSQFLPRTCNCTDNHCVPLDRCPSECVTVCMHRYNLGRLQCNAIGIEASISLDLICDGKSDCHDDLDESRCLIVPGLSLFESNNMYKYILDIITTKMNSVYYKTIRYLLLNLQKSIKSLQKASTTKKIDMLKVKTLREECFSQIIGIYDKIKLEAQSMLEMIDIYIFLLAINEKLVVAMKLSNTGNKRITDPDECMCMNKKCLYLQCSEQCSRACSAEHKLKRYHCGESLYNNRTIPIESICDGKVDCPDKDDEKDCSKDVCVHHHLVLLRQNLLDAANTGNNMTSLGEELKAWAEKVLSTLLVPGSERVKPKVLQGIVAKALHDLLKTYAEILPSRKRSDDDIIENFYKLGLVLMKGLKSCGK